MSCAKVHASILPKHDHKPRPRSTCGMVWWWTKDRKTAVTDDLREVTCKRCLYLLTVRGLLPEQLQLPL